jgi:hypothetical protein
VLLEIADAGELPIRAHRPNKGRAGDLIVADVVDLQPAGIGVAQHHVAGAATAEIADAGELPI